MARRPTEIPIERRVRVGILGLGQVYDLCVTGYQGNPDAEIVALCDVEPGRVDERAGDWPNAERFVDIEDFLQADMDLVEVLVPTPLHCNVACAVLEAGYHVNLQKPIVEVTGTIPELEFPSNWSDGRLQEPSS
jgi:predicted dehydrogenase